MQFKDIVGQRDTINRLTEIIDGGRISHAQMVVGDTRHGALQLALAYVQYLCCEHRVHHSEGDLRADSCGECPQCKKIASLQHPDLHLFFPTSTTSRVKKDPTSADFAEEFRSFLSERNAQGSLNDWYLHIGAENKQGIIRAEDANILVDRFAMKSYEGKWRMAVIWMAENMAPAFANKILKTLEEPYEESLLLLVCEQPDRLLPTIRSRVQLISMDTTVDDGVEARRLAAQYAPLIVSWLRLLFKLKMKELSNQVDEMAKLTREQQKEMLGYALELMRGCFLHTAAGLPVQIGSGDAKFDAMFPQMVTPNNISLIESAIDEAIFAIERNGYGRLVLMELSFRMSKALKKR